MPAKLGEDRKRIPQWVRIVNKSYIACNYRLQGGNLQAKWYQNKNPLKTLVLRGLIIWADHADLGEVIKLR